MNKLTRILIITMLLTSAFLMHVSINTEAVGISPISIEMTNIARGQNYYERTFMVWNTRDTEVNITLEPVGDGKDWITLYLKSDENRTTPINSVRVPGQNWSEDIVININVPSYTPVGNYTAEIDAYESGGADVTLIAPLMLSIQVVGEQNLNGKIVSIFTNQVEIGDNLVIVVEFENTGNVVATPEIEANILINDIPVNKGKIVNDSTSVKINERKEINLVWDTSGREPGNYTANITVKLDGKLIANEKKDFELFAYGELSTEVELKGLSYEGELSVGSIIKVYATVRNVGRVNVKAKFIGEVYLNNVLIDTINSKELQSDKLKTTVLPAYLTLDEPGDYVIRGYVTYGVRETPTEVISFHVGGILETSLPFLVIFGVLGGAGAILYVKRETLLNMRRSRQVKTIVSKREKNRLKKDRVKKEKKRGIFTIEDKVDKLMAPPREKIKAKEKKKKILKLKPKPKVKRNKNIVSTALSSRIKRISKIRRFRIRVKKRQ